MGAQFDSARLKATNMAAAQVEFKELQEQLRHDHGHRGYTGTLAEARGLSFTRRVFKTEDEARVWLDEHALKWYPALAVQVEGVPGYLVGACCSC